MIKYKLVVVLVFLAKVLLAQYPVSSIPEELTKKTDCVVRRHDYKLEVKSDKEAQITIKTAITILNEQGVKFGHFSESFDSNTKLSKVKGSIYNAAGKLVRKISSGDFKDYNVDEYGTLLDDSKTKYCEVLYPSYPYTVEYEYRVDVSGYIGLPTFFPVLGYGVSVEEANFTLIYPTSHPIRYKSFGVDQPKQNAIGVDVESLSWSVVDFPSVEPEYFTPVRYEVLPMVLLSPGQFFYDGYSGDFSSWNTYGMWVASLIKGREDLSSATKEKVKLLVAGASTETEKVRRIYKFMQGNTRYVSIQLGIGGFQPFPASFVESKGFGDCKALVNYTKALLSEAGIKSYYTEIGVHGTRISYPEFPSANQTNHIVLCVPIENDTLWLECTNQRNPFGLVPASIQNQIALLIDEEKGGVLVNTAHIESGNRQERTLTLSLLENGTVEGSIETKTYNGEIENLFPELWQARKDQENIILKKYKSLTPTLGKIEYDLNDSTQLYATEFIGFSAKNFASVSGDRLFFPVNPIAVHTSLPPKQKNRRGDLEIRYAYSHVDTTQIKLPVGYRLEMLPKPALIENQFGSYSLKVVVDNGVLTCVRAFSIKLLRLPPAEYDNFVTFLTTVNKSDRQTAVIVKDKADV